MTKIVLKNLIVQMQICKNIVSLYKCMTPKGSKKYPQEKN